MPTPTPSRRLPAGVLCYIPELLPDQLLYSFLSEIVAYSALGEPRSYLPLFFGTKDIISVVDLPTRIEPLHDFLGTYSPCASPKDIIEKATLYPYHRPFLTLERHRAVEQILLHGGRIGLKTLLGRVANRFGANPPLRFCVACIEEDINGPGGVPYWRRMHQLPGVTACAIHGIDLIADVCTTVLPDRQRFRLVPPVNNVRMPRIDSEPRQVWFARLSRDLLEAHLPALDSQIRIGTYLSSARNLGFCDAADGRIDFASFTDAVRTHYNDFEGFIHRERLLSTESHPLAWLRDLFCRPSRAAHPICHLLLIGFLFRNFQDFARKFRLAAAAAEPNSKSKASSVATVAVRRKRRDHRAEALLQDRSISCREAATQLGLSVSTVVSHRRVLGIPISERRKSVSDEKLNAVAGSLRAGMNPTSVARLHSISIASVYRIRRQTTGLEAANVACLRDEQLRQKKKQWHQAIDSLEDGVGVSAARRTAPAVYAWLYRNARAWLRGTCVRLCSPHVNECRVDWKRRDQKLSCRLIEIAEEIRNREGRPRISKTMLLRQIGEPMVRKNLRRLPKVNKALERLVESKVEFQIFRIDKAFQRLRAQGVPVSRWRVQKVAGIRKWSHVLGRYFSKCCEGA